MSTSIIPQIVDPGIADGRLTLTSGVPVTTADVTSSTNVYYTPYKGNQIALYDGTRWVLVTFTEVTQALGTLTSGKPYDVFGYLNSSGALATEMLVWTNDTTRATAVTLTNGVYTKSGDQTRRLLGTFYTTSTTTTADTAGGIGTVGTRYLSNAQNKVDRRIFVGESTDSWVYTTAAWRQVNAAAGNRCDYVDSLGDELVKAHARASGSSATFANVATGIGIDVTNATNSNTSGSGVVGTFTAMTDADYAGYPGVGKHSLNWLEYGGTTATFYGDGGAPTFWQNGLTAFVRG